MTKYWIEEPQHIGEIIAKQRKRWRMSQAELAQLVGVDQQTISHWESASHVPHIGKLLDAFTKMNVRLYCTLPKRAPKLGGVEDGDNVEEDSG